MLYPKDYDESKNFYANILSFEIHKEWEKGIILDTGSGVVDLFRTDSLKGTGIGISLEVSDLKKLLGEIKRSGRCCVSDP
jgi:glyoxylase I family protein